MDEGSARHAVLAPNPHYERDTCRSRELSVRGVREWTAAWITPNTIRIGAIGGIGYALIALWVYAAIRGIPFGGLFTLSRPDGIVVAAYVCFGLVLLGGIPLVLLYRGRLVTPLAALVVLFSWASYETWRSLEAARAVGADPGVSLRPDSAFFLFWFLPLGIVLLLGGVEYALRTALSGHSLEDAFD